MVNDDVATVGGEESALTRDKIHKEDLLNMQQAQHRANARFDDLQMRA